MANLALTVDYGLKRLVEPGFTQQYAARDLAAQAVPADAASARGFWSEPETGTLMLQPLQFRSDWLNSAEQVTSIIDLAQMNANAADLAAGRIFEADLFGNPNNPWIHHSPASPAALTPLTGNPTTINLTPIESITEGTLDVTGSAPGFAPGTAADGDWICGTAADLAANQALYIRFHWPESKVGHQTIYTFVYAQFAIMVRENQVELFVDTSAAGDRSSWAKVAGKPINEGFAETPAHQRTFGQLAPIEANPHYRSLFVLPFRRNQLLVMGNFGRRILYRTGQAHRLPDNSDWDIARADTFDVWALSQSPGHFQIQKVKWKDGPVKINLPHVRMDYTPAVDPVALLDVDTDHGTSITPVVDPTPDYDDPVNSLDKCPPPTTDASAQGKAFGVTLTFDASSDQRWTPFLYKVILRADRTLLPALTTPVTHLDTEAQLTRVQRGTITVGEKAGEGKLEASVLDFDPFSFSGYYYRSGYALSLSDFTAPSTFVPHFVGLAEPNEVVPWRFDNDVPRGITVLAADLWKQLSESFLRDQQDFGAVPGERKGYGHITTVRFVAEQAGIDVTLADTPAAGGPLDWELGGLDVEANQISHELNPGWKPKLKDTAATFIERIATLFSGWVYGFHADGQFYYHPRDQYLTSGTPAVIFYPDAASRTLNHVGPVAALPSGIYRDPVEFRTLEPQANVIVVAAGRDTDGAVTLSSQHVDFASIINPTVVNFLGRWKASVIEVGGVFSCGELNRMARIVFDEARRRKIRGTVRADYLTGLKTHRRVRLFGYGDYRLVSYSVDFERHSWHDAALEVELIERGHSLP